MDAESKLKMDTYVNDFFQDLESMWSDAGVIYCDPSPSASETKYTPPTPIEERYGCPSCPYAQSIWDACGFRSSRGERKRTIEYGLVDWAETQRCAYIGKDEQPWIRWRVGSTPVSGRWPAFVTWFLCSCTKVQYN